MKKVIITSILIATAAMTGCHKTDNNNNSATAITDSTVIHDFVQKTALPQYQNLQDKATALNNSVINLKSNLTDANLAAAKQAWQDTRQAWEQCEGFLFGPVEDNNYDPYMDTWPVDYVQLDSLMASSNPLQLADIQNLNVLSLRGFHPLEYILWGKNGNGKAADITAREQTYMISLAADIQDITTSLNSSWTSGSSPYQQEILLAGNGSTHFKSREEICQAIAGAMTDICNEVGAEKMSDPFNAKDSTITESPFSHNSLIDFKNNIIGAQNVYLCSYQAQGGASLSALVAAKNAQLDNQIKQQFTAAITSFGNITMTFEQAIYLQPTQVKNTINALATLQATLDGQLKLFIATNIKD